MHQVNLNQDRMKLPQWKAMTASRNALYTGCVVSLLLAHAELKAQAAVPPPAEQIKKPAANDAGASQKKEKSAETSVKPDSDTKSSVSAATEAVAVDDGTIVLSPFEVTTEKDRGYYGGKAMSGTRLGADIEDIPASITVVTKQQLTDMAAVDINDIFAAEVSTEGIRNFTANSNDGKQDVDTVAQSPETANRIRGLGSANISVGNFGATSSIPIDIYNVDAVEISRGPNSSIFGLGDASGTVNLVPSAANLSKAFTRVSFSGSSYGTTRGTIDINRPIFKDVLAIRVNGVINNQEYLRKPSFDKTKRLQISATYRPFRFTTLRGTYEKFDEKYTRPNSTTPYDYVKLWKAVGSPSWNPRTNTWTYIDANGVTQTGGTATPSSSYAFSTAGGWISGLGSSAVRPSMFISGGQSQWFGHTGWVESGRRTLATLSLPSNYNVPEAYQGTLPYVAIPATTDKSFYDYENVNSAGLNYGKKNAETVRLELEQFFLNGEFQKLAAQVGYFRENIADYRRSFVGSGGDGVPMAVLPDVNTVLPDGTPNPFYGKPYLTALAPQTFAYPVDTHTFRTTLAYEIDFKALGGLWKHVGKHRLIGYDEEYEKFSVAGGLRYRDQIVQQVPLYLTGNIRNNNSAIFNARYYYADSSNGNINSGTTSASYANNITFSRYGTTVDNATTRWLTESVPVGTAFFSLQNPTKIYTETRGFIWQGFLWGDRIVPTVGRRMDKRRSRTVNSVPGHALPEPTSLIDSNGLSTDLGWVDDVDENIAYDITNPVTRASVAKGYTDTKGIVLKVLPWLHLRYNQSNSFNPTDYGIDYQGNPLPNPYGETKDYGVRLNLFSNKLSVDVNYYDTISVGARLSSVNVVANRITSLDFDTDPSLDGSKYDLEDWLKGEYVKALYPFAYDSTTTSVNYSLLTEAQAADVNNRAWATMGLSPELITSLRSYTKATTSDLASKGYELVLNYNPTRHFSLKITGSKSESVNDRIAPTWQKYRDERLKYWESIRSPYDNQSWWDGSFTAQNGTLNWKPKEWYAYNNLAPMKVQIANQGKRVTQDAKYKFSVLPRFELAGITSNSILKAITVGGKYSWIDKRSIGYYGAAPEFISGTGYRTVDYDVNRPIWSKSQSYVDLFATYKFRMFGGKVGSSLQLNVRNVTESGRLEPFTANPDGTLTRYRIIDPREFVLSLSMDL